MANTYILCIPTTGRGKARRVMKAKSAVSTPWLYFEFYNGNKPSASQTLRVKSATLHGVVVLSQSLPKGSAGGEFQERHVRCVLLLVM